jgi:hypothetical protein
MSGIRRFLIACILSMGASSLLLAQSETKVDFSAYVFPDSSKPTSVYVTGLKLDFKFAGYGTYIPSEYPTLTELPLETGERISFEKIAEITFKAERVQWKQYVEPEQRHQYDSVDEQGYRYWSDVEVVALVKDWQGESIRSRIVRPEISDVYLSGKTPRGEFRLQIDQENNKNIHVVFEPLYKMICAKDVSHIFPNSSWTFCPICGGKLKKMMP